MPSTRVASYQDSQLQINPKQIGELLHDCGAGRRTIVHDHVVLYVRVGILVDADAVILAQRHVGT